MRSIRNAIITTALAFATHASAQVVFFEQESFGGRSFTVEGRVENFSRAGFNDRASSVVVYRDRWEVCTDARFQGGCTILRPGRYSSLSAFGLNDRISSVRPVDGNTRVADQLYAPPPLPVYDNYPRRNERLHEAKVISVRAVYGTPEQRCWVETPQVAGMAVNGVLGGVIGHQVGRAGDEASEYLHAAGPCKNIAANAAPDHWDVVYESQGVEHRMQTLYRPGATITVNAQGEPRS